MTGERGAWIPCPDCGDIILGRRGPGCETCGHTGYVIIEVTEVLAEPVNPGLWPRGNRG
jgi:hypothetical protein